MLRNARRKVFEKLYSNFRSKRSKVVMRSREVVSWIRRQRNIKACLRWLADHNDMAGSVGANGLAKQATKRHIATIKGSQLPTIFPQPQE